MPEYTYSPAAVLVEITAEFAIGATGVFRSSSGGDPVQVYDLNDSPIASVVVGPRGAHQAFKADIPSGLLDFGSTVLTKVSDEAQVAAITAITTAESASNAAQQALDLAQEARDAAGTNSQLVLAYDNPQMARPTDNPTQSKIWLVNGNPANGDIELDWWIPLLRPVEDGPSGEIPPAVPTGLSAVATRPTQVILTWSPVGDSTYDLQRDGVIIHSNLVGTSFIDSTGIAAGSTHTYAVRAYDATSDLRSAFSEARTVTTPLAEPTGVAFTDTFTRADATSLGADYLEWTSNKFGISSNRALPLVNSMTLAAGATQCTGGSQYAEVTIAVLASDTAWMGPCVRVPVDISTTGSLSGGWYTLLVSTATNNALSIRRKDDNATSMTTLITKTKQIVAGDVLRIEVEGDTTPTIRGYVNGALELTYQDTNVAALGTANTRCGINTLGTAAAGRLDNFAYGDLGTTGGGTPTAPEVPLGLTATAVSPSRIELVWEESANTDYYEWRRNSGTPISTTIASASDTGLAASTTYNYSVRAVNAVGASAWTSNVPATTQAAPVSAPAVPTGAAATVVSSTQINYSWNEVAGATTYEVERNGTLRTGLTSTFVNDTGLTASTSYSYRVRARNSAGESAFTALSVVTTQSGSTGGGGTPDPNQFMFGMTATQIKALPKSGTAWTKLLADANKSITVNPQDISSAGGSLAFAAALVYVATGDTSYRTKVVNALETLRTWSGGFYYSAVYRSFAGYVMAADLVGHRTPAMLSFFDQSRLRQNEGTSRFAKNMYTCAWDTPANHGGHARGAYIATSLFIGDKAAVTNAKKWVKFFLGDDSEWGQSTSGIYNAGTMSPTDLPITLTWTHDPNNWVGINPLSSIPTKEGALPMDIERDGASYAVSGGKPVWGASGEQYTHGCMMGTLVAMQLLSANGYPDIWSWSDNAGIRWRNYLHRYGSTYVHGRGGWISHFLNRKYTSAQRNGVTYSGSSAESYGFNHTEWLYP